jgi:hypothetical protein
VIIQHTGVLHVVDARTFETEETINVPKLGRYSSRNRSASPTPIPAPAPTRGHISPPLPQPIQSYHPLRIPSAISALEDTFRVWGRSSASPHPAFPLPLHDQSMQTSDSLHSHRTRSAEDVVVIPPMGDQEIDSNLQALLDHHITIYRPRRSQSPTPAISRTQETGLRSPSSESVSSTASVVPTFVSSSSAMGHMSSHGNSSGTAGSYRRDSDDVDIAGVCFDPQGTSVYVGTTTGIAEWAVRGADKTWWTGERDEGWL